jgi:hypothetical protein
MIPLTLLLEKTSFDDPDLEFNINIEDKEG